MDFEISYFSISVQIPNCRKNTENKNYYFCTQISTVSNSQGPPMHMILPLESSKEFIEKAPEENEMARKMDRKMARE